MTNEVKVEPQVVSTPPDNRDGAINSILVPDEVISPVVIPPPKKKGKPRGRPFVKGDPRIKRTGSPMKNFADLRKMGQAIAERAAINKADGKMYQVAELILMQMAQSKDPREHQKFLEICYGKVPDVIDLQGQLDVVSKPMTDEELAARIVQILNLARERMMKKQEGEESK